MDVPRSLLVASTTIIAAAAVWRLLESTRHSTACARVVTRRRAAFDIGSGATKLLVVEVEIAAAAAPLCREGMTADDDGAREPFTAAAAAAAAPGAVRIVGEPLFAEEVPLAFKADAQRQPDGALSNEIMERGLVEMERLAAVARALGASEACAVATEVFRSAPNGARYLARVAERTGVRARVISQDDEVRLARHIVFVVRRRLSNDDARSAAKRDDLGFVLDRE